MEAHGTTLTANGIDFAVGPGQRGGFNLAREAGSGENGRPFFCGRRFVRPYRSRCSKRTHGFPKEMGPSHWRETACFENSVSSSFPPAHSRSAPAAVAAATDAGTTNLCTTVAQPCVAFPAGTAESVISGAINTAAANTTFVFDAGTFQFTNTLTPPNVSGLVFTGQGIGSTVLDFSGQAAGTTGISVTGNSKVTFTKFTIQNTLGDAIKVEGANGVLFDTVQAQWTNPSGLTHGAYGTLPGAEPEHHCPELPGERRA